MSRWNCPAIPPVRRHTRDHDWYWTGESHRWLVCGHLHSPDILYVSVLGSMDHQYVYSLWWRTMGCSRPHHYGGSKDDGCRCRPVSYDGRLGGSVDEYDSAILGITPSWPLRPLCQKYHGVYDDDPHMEWYRLKHLCLVNRLPDFLARLTGSGLLSVL